MVPTWRALALALLGLVPIVINATGNSAGPWLILAFVIAAAGLWLLDARITPKPEVLEIARINEPKLSLGAQNRIALAIHNAGPRPLELLIRDEFPHEFPSDALLHRVAVAPDEVAEVAYHVRPLRRGDYRFGKINVRYPSVMKLFMRQTAIDFAEVVKVYPNILDIRKYDLLARKGMLFEIGLRNAKTHGSGSEFERLRDYSADDEFRRINWRASARRNKLIVNEYETERSQHIVSVVDTGRLMRPTIDGVAKLDYALNAILMLSYVSMLKGDHIGLMSFADHVGRFLLPRRGKSQFYQLLEQLYNVPAQPVESDYARALAYLGLKNKRRSLIVLFTDLSTLDAAEPLIRHVSRLAKTHLVVCVTMSDPGLTGFQGQSVASSEAAFERAVAEMVLDERRLVIDTLHQTGVHTIDVPANQLTVAVINKYMELKGRGAI